MTPRLRALSLPAVLCASFFAHGQTVTLVGTYQGQTVGSGAYTLTKKPDGSFVKSLSVQLKIGDQTYESSSSHLIAAGGKLIEIKMRAATDGKTTIDQTITLDKKVAMVTDRLTGKHQTLPLPADHMPAGPYELWFLSVKPKIGQQDLTCEYQPGKGWLAQTVTYTGDQKITVNGRQETGHVLSVKEGAGTTERVLDDRGVLLKIGAPNVPGLVFTCK